jgi:hypothetical protein
MLSVMRRLSFIWDYDLDEAAFRALLAGQQTLGKLDRDWAAVCLLVSSSRNSWNTESVEAPGSRGARLVGGEVERSETNRDHESKPQRESVASNAHIVDMQPTSNKASRDASALECPGISGTGR